MKSVILTKIKKVQLSFKDQITELRENGELNFLKEFVQHCHKNGRFLQVDENTIEVSTKNNNYRYSCFPNYIRKINRTTEERSFYKIS